jgi:peptide/nickel transport system substrate-binding protein
MRNKNQLLIFLTLITFMAACTCGKKKGSDATTDYGKNELVVHELSDVDKLNPTNSTDAGAIYIEDMLFMQLLDVNKKTMQIVPELAIARPTVIEITDGEYKGGLAITYEIRNDAKWDNGTPVLASDFDFTYKTLLHPLLDNEQGRSTLDFLKAIVIDPANDRKFTLYTNQKHYLSEFITGSVYVIPEYIYDPTHALKNTALSYITNPIYS